VVALLRQEQGKTSCQKETGTFTAEIVSGCFPVLLPFVCYELHEELAFLSSFLRFLA